MATAQEFTISDTLWARLSPPFCRCTRPSPIRWAATASAFLTGIFFVLRTGCQWKALSATGSCSSSTAHSRLRQWVQAGASARRWVVERTPDEA